MLSVGSSTHGKGSTLLQNYALDESSLQGVLVQKAEEILGGDLTRRKFVSYISPEKFPVS